jgi:CheY-like chemotaxis protein
MVGLRVLVVDDDDDILGAVADILTLAGCVVETASTLGEARAKVAWTRPSLVFCDWDLGGDERSSTFLRTLARDRPEIALVLVTASARAEWKALVEGGVVQRTIGKPFDAHELLTAAASLRSAGARAQVHVG